MNKSAFERAAAARAMALRFSGPIAFIKGVPAHQYLKDNNHAN